MVSCCAKKGATHGERRRSGPLKGPWAGEACVLGDVGRTHHCLGPNNRQRNRPEVDGTQRRAMRVRAARPRRNVQQCEQELLHSAAPTHQHAPRTESEDASESFFLSSTPGAPRLLNIEFNTTRARARTTSEDKLLCCSTRKEVSTIVKRVLPSTPIQRWCPKSVRGVRCMVRWLRFGSKIRGIV